MNPPAAAAAPASYALSSDLARLCLPAATQDANRKLAYVNSICCLFLVVGLIGLKMPQPHVREIAEEVEFVPVVFTPPEQPPPTQQEVPEEPPEEVPEVALDAPVVATVVAADASAVAFAVPVQGPVILAPARFAVAPPRVTRAPPQPTRFVPTGREAGSYPWPSARDYPRVALIEKQEGSVMLHVIVGEDGAPSSVTIKDSSSHAVLDRVTMDWVRSKWRWPPGPVRHYYVPFIWQIPK